MKIQKFIFAALAIGVAFSSCKTSGSKSLKTEIDTVSYYLGIAIGKQMQPSGISGVNYELFAKGFEEAITQNKDLKLTDEQVGMYLQTYFQDLQMKESEKNAEEGKKYMEENKKKPGVQTTPSGLQYEVIKQGTGAKPVAESEVTVHYTGTTIDGNIFDSSIERGQPATFKLNEVIPGWTEGIQLMSVGSKFKLYIPSELAYGANPQSPKIKPNSVLIFDVELLEVK